MSRSDTALRFYREMSEASRLREASSIELNRKGDAHITVDAPEGSEITLEIEQTNHEFRFGGNLLMLDEFETAEKNAIYREKFAELFNLGTVPFYWDALEPEKGKPRYAADSYKIYRRPPTDLCVDYCLEHGIEPKCHCLNYDNFIPEWLKGATVEEYKLELDRRMREIAERYADKIPSFEVTNETLQPPTHHRSAFYHEDDYVEWSFRRADRYFPNNRLIINDYEIRKIGEYNNRNAYYMQIERLLRNGITHLDSIGLQFHSFFPLADEENHAPFRYNPDRLWGLMDLYAKLGLAEQITEMTIPAYSGGEEDEAVQAELLCSLYRTFFAHPAMEAVIYWNLVDGYAFRAEPGDMTAGENKYYGGLLRFDMSEKPAFTQLKKLIHEEWNTRLTVPVINGKASFRGFWGDYRITAHANGKSIPVSFKLSKKRENTASIRL